MTQSSQSSAEFLSVSIERRSPTRDRPSVNPLLMILAFQVFDVLAPTLIGYLSYLAYDASGPTFWSICGKFCAVATVFSALIFHLCDCYSPSHLFLGRGTVLRLIRAFVILVFVGLLTAFFSKSMSDVSRIWTVIWLGSWLGCALVLRVTVLSVVSARAAKGALFETVAVVGATEWADNVYDQLLKQDNPTQRIVGVFDDRQDRISPRFASTVRPINDLIELGRHVHIDRVVMALPLTAEGRIMDLSRRIMALSVDILACPDLREFHLLRRPMVTEAGMPSIHITRRPISYGDFLVKTAADKFVSAVLLILLIPVMLLITLGTKLTSPGPVFFRQRRHGYNNREFEMLKFRSMRIESSDLSGGQQTKRNDSRVTAFGRFLRRTSLDELPQLINVLVGDMSLVGPRPLPIGMRTHDLYNHNIVEEYAHRHRVRPGITGWAQINGSRGATETPEQLMKRVEMDIYYIENWSLAFDIKIMFLTALHLLRPTNAY